jgi:FAD/FMN-containing dehydrogenase
MRSVHVDTAARRVRVEPGATLADLDHETQAFGLAVPVGINSTTGVAGLTLGGGFGWISRKHGLTIDNLLSADLVTAEGEAITVSESSHPDLFWAIRGGGGNFGIVTSFEFQLHPMERRVIAGQVLFPIERARDVLTLYGEYGPAAPDALQLDCLTVLPPGGAPGMSGFGVCWSGDASGADRALAPIRRLGTPVVDSIGPMDYVALQRSGDIDDPRAQGQYVKAGFLSSLPARLVSAIVEGFEGHPQRATILVFQQGGGAIGRVAPGDTAFSQRNAIANMLCFVDWPSGTDPAGHIRWIREYWATLESFTDGFYVNDVEAGMTDATIRENYRQNHERLVAVKNRFDPKNLFRLNANVKPTV